MVGTFWAQGPGAGRSAGHRQMAQVWVQWSKGKKPTMQADLESQYNTNAQVVCQL